MKVKKESEKPGWKLNIWKTKIMASSSIISWQIDGGKNEISDRLNFLGLQNHCGRWLQSRNWKTLAPWRKSYDKPQSAYLKTETSLCWQTCVVKAMFFLVLMYGCESWTIKKAKHQRTDAFKLWCWRRLLSVPWAARKTNQSILKEINHWILVGRTEAEAPIV